MFEEDPGLSFVGVIGFNCGPGLKLVDAFVFRTLISGSNGVPLGSNGVVGVTNGLFDGVTGVFVNFEEELELAFDEEVDSNCASGLDGAISGVADDGCAKGLTTF
jgi:hypothetical protein